MDTLIRRTFVFKGKTSGNNGHKNGHSLSWFSSKIKKNLFFATLPILLAALFSSDKIRSWADLFPDPIERIYIIMEDGVSFKQTNHEERRINLTVGRLEEALKKTSYRIKDIAIIIHNHRFEREFSESDWGFYRDLKKHGFNGRFLLYCHLTKEVYEIEKKEESK